MGRGGTAAPSIGPFGRTPMPRHVRWLTQKEDWGRFSGWFFQRLNRCLSEAGNLLRQILEGGVGRIGLPEAAWRVKGLRAE